MIGKPESPLGRVGMEIDELGFDPEDAGVADAELAEVVLGAALILDTGNGALDEKLMSTTLFSAVLDIRILLTEELAREEVIIGTSVLEGDPAIIEGPGYHHLRLSKP